MRDPTPEPTSVRPRRPYTRPRLSVHGTLQDLTLMNGGTVGMNDMGGGKDKTGF